MYSLCWNESPTQESVWRAMPCPSPSIFFYEKWFFTLGYLRGQKELRVHNSPEFMSLLTQLKRNGLVQTLQGILFFPILWDRSTLSEIRLLFSKHGVRQRSSKLVGAHLQTRELMVMKHQLASQNVAMSSIPKEKTLKFTEKTHTGVYKYKFLSLQNRNKQKRKSS